jgi:hypothetical protein
LSDIAVAVEDKEVRMAAHAFAVDPARSAPLA